MTTSLDAALRTWKVDTGFAPQMESDRYIGNGQNKLCPMWGGYDNVGRMVNPDTFYTKSGGCNSPEDLVYVENQVVRPRYYEYIMLDPQGMQGSMRQINGFGTGVRYALTSDNPEALRQHHAQNVYLNLVLNKWYQGAFLNGV